MSSLMAWAVAEGKSDTVAALLSYWCNLKNLGIAYDPGDAGLAGLIADIEIGTPPTGCVNDVIIHDASGVGDWFCVSKTNTLWALEGYPMFGADGLFIGTCGSGTPPTSGTPAPTPCDPDLVKWLRNMVRSIRSVITSPKQLDNIDDKLIDLAGTMDNCFGEALDSAITELGISGV